MNTMKIMHLLNHCGKANGHVNVSVDLACTQVRMGHTVGYGCANGDFLELLRNQNVHLYRIEQPHSGLVSFFQANWQLSKAIRDFRPDILHAHMAAQSVLVQPYRILGYKFVTTLHNEFDRSAWLMGLADRVIAVGQTGYDSLRRQGIPKARIHVIQNGPVGSPRLSSDFSPAELSHPAILTICGMHPRKGVGDLLQAFSHLRRTNPTPHLYLVGEGPMLQAYKDQAEQLGLNTFVHFLGFCDDPRPYLFASDIFVLASHADPGPLVIAEARNAGLPIIASAVDGIPAMLDEGEAGILVPPCQPNALADAMRRFLDDPELLMKYAVRAKQGAERFTVQRVCFEIEKVYIDLLNSQNSMESQ